MTITAQYTNAERTFVNATLEPGDHLASEYVQAAYNDKMTNVPAGNPKIISIPCNDDNPVWLALKYLHDAGIVQIKDFEPPRPLDTTQVSDTQFIQALAEWGVIQWSEAQAWGSKGELPQLLVKALDSIEDTTTRNRAYMKAMSAKTYVLSDPWLLMLAEKLPGWDKQKLQELFNFAATL